MADDENRLLWHPKIIAGFISCLRNVVAYYRKVTNCDSACQRIGLGALFRTNSHVSSSFTLCCPRKVSLSFACSDLTGNSVVRVQNSRLVDFRLFKVILY
jgi:hypothetical protein